MVPCCTGTSRFSRHFHHMTSRHISALAVMIAVVAAIVVILWWIGFFSYPGGAPPTAG